jgi:heterodisulfide reductase subunit A
MAEKNETNEKPRIGVFVCHCGSNIGGFVDVPSVAEYAKTLPDVVYATDNLYTCADDGLTAIKEGIRKHNLNRVIVASCTPRTHAPLFQATCESAGLNKYLFTFVNIREHCSWVHMKEKEKATRKARDLVRMGVARARLLEAQEEVKVDVTAAGLVIGGGVSGMTAALSLADMGFPVHLVEKEGELGGFVRNLNNLYVTEKSAAETIKPLIEKVKTHKNINLHLNSQVKSVEGFIGNYEIVIGQKGAEDVKSRVGTIVVATGALEFVPEGLYGYNQYPNIVTLTEFEILCKKKTLPKLKNVAFIQCVGSRGQDKSYCSRICCNVGIKNAINIMDNYENMLGLMEKAGTVVEKIPVEQKVPEEILDRRRRRRGRERGEEGEAEEVKLGPSERIEVTVFNRDVMAYGVEHELTYNKAREKRVKFVRYAPEHLPRIYMEGNQLTVGYFHETLRLERTMPVDMVILATPLVAQPDAGELSQMLKVPLGQEGFFLEAHVKLRPVDFATDGIYVCGTCRGPSDITECVTQAAAAASRAAIPLSKGYVLAEAIASEVNTDLCVGCGICATLCPYSAITVVRGPKGMKAEVIKAACKGCGACGAGCPEKAMTMLHYTDEQLIVEGLAGIKEVVL